MNVYVETFIAARVLEFLLGSYWAGDNRDFDELGSHRTLHEIKMLFKNGEGRIIDEVRSTGITHKLDSSLGVPIETGQATGETLKNVLWSEYTFLKLNLNP